jgi:TPR repeat protein
MVIGLRKEITSADESALSNKYLCNEKGKYIGVVHGKRFAKILDIKYTGDIFYFFINSLYNVINFGWHEAYSYALKRFTFLDEDNIFIALAYVNKLMESLGGVKITSADALRYSANEIRTVVYNYLFNKEQSDISYINDDDYGLKINKPMLFRCESLAVRYIKNICSDKYTFKRTFKDKSPNFEGDSICFEIYKSDVLVTKIYVNCYYPEDHEKDVLFFLSTEKTKPAKKKMTTSVEIHNEVKIPSYSLEEGLTNQENYGKAMIKIIDPSTKDEGTKLLLLLEENKFYEASLALGMYSSSSRDEIKKHFENAAKSGSSESLWRYSLLLEEPSVPNLSFNNDVMWEESVYEAATKGCRIAMQTIASMLDRAGRYVESFYWYKMCELYGSTNVHEFSIKEFQNWVLDGSPDIYVHYFDDFDEEKYAVTISLLKTMERGEPTEEDFALLMESAENGNALASHLLLSIIKDEKLELKLLPILCELDDHLALRKMGDYYKENDPNKAIKYYEKASALGNRRAMYSLGEYYKDSNKFLAAYYYGMALVRGHRKAKDALKELK